MKKFLCVTIGLIVIFSLMTSALASDSASRKTEWSGSIELSDEPGVTIEFMSAPSIIRKGDVARIMFRLINNREDDWSVVHWKVILPKEAVVQMTLYEEFPTFYSDIIRSGPDSSARVMMPPLSRGVITIFVRAPVKTALKKFPVSVEFDEGIYIPEEIEKLLRDSRPENAEII